MQNYGDENSTSIYAKARTVQRFTQRLLLSLPASVKRVTIHSTDITQAYIQARVPLESDVYIRSLLETNLSEGLDLKMENHFTGPPESWQYWYLTCVEHHTKKLVLKRSCADHCLLFKEDGTSSEALDILEVDNILIVGLLSFF